MTETNDESTSEAYVYVTRCRDGKTVGGSISGHNGAAALYCLCGGVHEGYCYSERDVKTRQFQGGKKGLPYLGSRGEEIAANLIQLFNQA